MDLASLGILGLIVFMFVDFVKYATNKNWSAVLTQLLLWVAAIGAVFLVAQTVWGQETEVWEHALSDLGGFDLLVVGLAIGGAANGLNQIRRTFDSTQTAAVPPLVPSQVNAAAPYNYPAEAIPPENQPGAPEH